MKQLLLGVLLLFGVQSSSPEINFFSPRQDIEIGTESSKEAEKQLSIVREAPLNQYIRSIAQRVLLNSAPRHFQYRFLIVNSNEIGSVGFPNGDIYIYRGLLSMASNDDEVAAIIAHEIGHIVSRHATSQLSRQLIIQAPFSLSSGLPTTEEWKDQLTRLGIVFGVNAPFLHYSPDQEVQAATVASRILTAARFEPQSLEAIFGKAVEAGKKNDEPLATFPFQHPVTQLTKTDSDPEGMRGSTLPHRRSTSEFRAFRSLLMKLPKPAEKEISVDLTTDALPNVFNHPSYKLNYPENWQITRIPPNGAIITAPDGLRTSTTGDDVSLGAMIDIFDLSTLDKPLPLEQSTNRLIVHLRQRNITVRAVPGAQSPTLIHDEPALRTVLLRGGTFWTRNSKRTESSEVLWLVTRMYYSNLFYMVFVASEEEFPAQQQVFEQMIRSVQIK